MKSWLDVPSDSDFPLQNIPFGIFSTADLKPRPGTRIGDTVIDLKALAENGYFDGLGINDLSVFSRPVLNDFISLGKPLTNRVRQHLLELFSEDNPALRNDKDTRRKALNSVLDVIMHLPVEIGDYTDFYSSEEHATNVGKMFRDPANALLPNWKHIPVGYHGRASSIVISGTNIKRPNGQTKADDKDKPDFGPTQQFDFELEVGFIIGKSTSLGTSISTSDAEGHIFGLVLFNDLSARDIQKWEYVPLGPFLCKNFGSIVSPWIVTLEALEPFRVKGPVQVPEVLPYLSYDGMRNYDIHLEVSIEASQRSAVNGHQPGGNSNEITVCRSNFKYVYWNMCQQLAHHTVNGCNIRVGDLYASGTISGPEDGSYGSMLELTWKGTKPVKMPDGSERKFIHDGDTIVIKGWAEKDGLRVGFGEARTMVI
jgi:fumarylacetoacetase